MTSHTIEALVAKLSEDDWNVRRAAAQDLGTRGPAAKGALNALRERLLVEEDEITRGNALQAIAKIEEDKAALVTYLGTLLWDRHDAVRTVAVESLTELGPVAKEALNAIWDRVSVEPTQEISKKLVQAVSAIEPDRETLFSSCLGFLKGDNPKKRVAAALVLAELTLSPQEEEKASRTLWEAVRTSDELQVVDSALFAMSKAISNKTALVKQVVEDASLAPWKKGRFILFLPINDAVFDFWKGDGKALFPVVEAALGHDETNYYVLQWLERNFASIPDSARAGVVGLLSNCYKTRGAGFGVIKAVGGPEAVEQLLADPDVPQEYKGLSLFNEGREVLEQKWQSDKEAMLPLALAATKAGSWMAKQAVSDWLREKAAEVPRTSLDKVVAALERLSEDADTDVRNSAHAALIQFKQRERDTKASPLLEVIRDPKSNEDTKVEAIGKLVQLKTREALRSVAGVWVRWIVAEEKPLVDAAAEAMLTSPLAVQPLIELFGQPLPREAWLRQYACRRRFPGDYLSLFCIEDDNALAFYLPSRQSLLDWVNTVRNDSEVAAELASEGEARRWGVEKLAREIVERVTDEEMKATGVRVQLRIARLLADMSDQKFFANEEAHRPIREELNKHAVPVLGRRLPQEDNVDIRECLAQTLGNIGGREAIDALARAVAGEERVRAFRQDLLAKYYLEPSKERSEEAAKILSEAVQEAKRTLRLLHGLNIAVFTAGLLLLAGGVTAVFVDADTSRRYFEVVAALGGLASLVTLLIFNPMDRIQHAMANLVQVETAFTSFIWELNLNGTYIQSQYVAEGVLTDNEIAQTVGRIEEAMSLAMNLVATYTQDRGPRVVTRVSTLVPAAGEAGCEVVLHGHHLYGDSRERKGRGGIVAVNHTPARVTDLSWGERAVKFRLPKELPGVDGRGGTVWLSLLVDGMETNALPFHVMSQPAATNGQPHDAVVVTV